MDTFIVKDIPEGSYFTKPAYFGERFILTAPEMPFTGEMKGTLAEWNITTIMSEGKNEKDYMSQSSGERGDAAAACGIEQYGGGQIDQAEDFYRSFLQYTDSLFTQIAATRKLEFSDVAEKMKDVCTTIKKKRRYLLRVIRNLNDGQWTGKYNYLTIHAVISTVISVIIGMYLKLPAHRLIELGAAALLHEVGMLKIPPQLYLNNRTLSPEERKVILTHPILSYKMLKASNFPMIIGFACLEHHERENGKGYPRKLTGDKIGLYAKIIAVACSYEALTNARPHKDAKDGHRSILDLLKNVGKQYNDTVVRALVYSLSLYPIGLYVLLSNGKKGQVVDVNPENPQFPIVHLLDEFTADGKNKTVETSATGLNIVRPLVRGER
ncbi:MAG: HD-GYP domain-containing protein [Spirochaetaceae bacterium]|jgi:HD-GYP domain-containing protein (c-di-GMP phosphodiesterase class II)|nr:HD-GYP domain-containing protein [Spirochaetaceae bacterium]